MRYRVGCFAGTAKRAVENNYLFRHEAEELGVLDRERNNKLDEACGNKMTAECAKELVTLSGAHSSFKGYNAQDNYNHLVNSEFQEVSRLHGEMQSQRMENLAKQALMEISVKEPVENAAILTQITVDALKGDATAKEQLRQIGSEIKKAVLSPIDTLSENTQAELNEVDQLEAAGYRDEADLIRMKVYLSNELTAISALSGVVGLTHSGIRNIGKLAIKEGVLSNKEVNIEWGKGIQKQGMTVAENAVENNLFNQIFSQPSVDWNAVAEGQAKTQDALGLVYEKYPNIMEAIEAGKTVGEILIDFTPILGDAKAFYEAEGAIDYALAVLGAVPFAGDAIVTLKNVKLVYRAAKLSESSGNLEDAKHQLKIAEQAIDKVRSEYAVPMGSRYNQMNQPKNPNYQPVRNKADHIDDREYSGHALDRMQDRGILPSVIENTIATGEKTVNELGVAVYKDKTNGVKVVTNENGKVITVTYEK